MSGRKTTLIIKIICILCVTIFPIEFLSLIYFQKVSSQFLYTNLMQTVENLADISKNSYGFSLSVYEKDYKQAVFLFYINNALLKNKHLVAVNVYYGDSYFVGLRKDLQNMQIIKNTSHSPFIAPENSPDIKLITGPVEYLKKTVGKYEIFYTERFLKQEIKNFSNEAVLVFALISLTTFLVIFLGLKKYFIRPVLRLAEITYSISEDSEYSLEQHYSAKDEIGILYSNFNNMIENIRHNQEELRKTKSLLSNIIESMPSMLITIDENGVVTQWNRMAEINTEIRAADILGKNIWEHTELFNDIKVNFREIIDRKMPMHISRKKLAFDTTRYNDVSFFPLIENGIHGVVMRLDDVTEIARKEEQLRQAQKMETVGTLAGGLAHDFNNVLSGIVGTVSLMKYLLKREEKIPKSELAELVKTIDESANRAADMVRQLLALSRRYELNIAIVEVNDVLRQVVKICKNTFDKCVEIILKDCEHLYVNADRIQLEQVVLNLCINAYHAMTIMRNNSTKRGGTLYINSDKIFADKMFCMNHPEALEQNYCVISVRDTGVGMKGNIISKIFDPFFTTKDKNKGTGLGLAMVYNIIQQHKGFIDVYSEEDIGTTFNVYIPFSEEQVFEEPNEIQQMVKKGSGTVLVVDDEGIVRYMAQKMLEECGYTVIVAENGENAVEQFKSYSDRIDVVILDMIMPRMSGKEVYRELIKMRKDIPVILASGFRQDERIESLMKNGVKYFIHKPYTIEKLSEIVYEAVNLSDELTES